MMPSLNNKKTNWGLFRNIINSELNYHISLKSTEELDAVIESFTKLIQKSCLGINAGNKNTEYHATLFIKRQSKSRRKKEDQKTVAAHAFAQR